MSAITRLDRYLEQHAVAQRKSLRAKPLARVSPQAAGPTPPPPPPAPLPSLSLKDVQELEATLLKEHRYRMHRLRQVRATLNSTLTLLERDDLALAHEASIEWDLGAAAGAVANDDGSVEAEGDGVGSFLQATKRERQAQAAMLLAAFEKGGNRAGEDECHEMSRLEISSVYINSLLGLS